MGWLKSIVTGEIKADAVADHLVLGDDYAILGLGINWVNSTNQSFFVDRLGMVLFPREKRSEKLQARRAI